MKGCLAILALLFLSGCSAFSYWGVGLPPPPLPPGMDMDIPAMEQIVISYGDELEKEKGLFLSDSRLYYDEFMESLWLKFTSQKIMDLCEARDVIVYLVEGLLARINESETLPLALYNFPWNQFNLRVDIEFESFHIKYVDRMYVARMILRDGIVYYYDARAIDPKERVWWQRAEPYVKAYRFSKFKTCRPWMRPYSTTSGRGGYLNLEAQQRQEPAKPF